MAEVVLIRHGETEWSRDGRHTGRTDVALTARGEAQARALAGVLAQWSFRLVLSSPLRRAWDTAELAGLVDRQPDPDLAEWDYGDVEGRTSDDVRRERPGWYLWSDGVRGGESIADVGARADRVLARIRPTFDDGGDVALVSHGHLLRVLGVRWIGLPPGCGSRLALGTASLCRLGLEHARPVLAGWNLPNPATGSPA